MTELPQGSLIMRLGASLEERKPPPPCQLDACVTPPLSSPSMTFFRRGIMWVWQCSPNSTMIQRRPILWATAPVVPEPAKESRMRSSGFVANSMMRFISRSGFGVSNALSAPKRAITSFFASLLCPTSELVHHVQAATPSCSDKNVLTRGRAEPSLPNQIRLSFLRFSKALSMLPQHLPAGGSKITPEGEMIWYIWLGRHP